MYKRQALSNREKAVIIDVLKNRYSLPLLLQKLQLSKSSYYYPVSYTHLAIKITLPDSDYTGNVEYQTYVQGIGWQSWKKNGELAGTSGQSKRIEAIRVKLTGEIAKYYEVYYSIHPVSYTHLPSE